MPSLIGTITFRLRNGHATCDRPFGDMKMRGHL